MEYNYSIITWLLFFYIYCFLGWIIESTIVSVTQKRPVNRGFIKGPLLPLYGSGSIIVLFFCLPFKTNIILVYIVGLVSATVLEYITGCLMEAIFHIKYWNYSNDFLNYKGRICLVSSLFWGFLSVLLTFVIHKPVEKFVLSINNVYLPVIVISVFFIIDFSYSVYTVLNLNKMLSFLTSIKADIETVVTQIKIETEKASSENLDSLKKKFTELTKAYDFNIKHITFFHKQIFRAYPKFRSEQFNKTLIDLKDKLQKKIFR